MKTAQTIIDSRQTLRQWIERHCDTDDAATGVLTEYVANRSDRPEWGEDWTSYLHRLNPKRFLVTLM